jgi:hypothetical protein
MYIYRGPTSYIMGYQDETRSINSGEVHPQLSCNWHPVDLVKWPKVIKRHAQSSNSGGLFLSSGLLIFLQLGLKDTLGRPFFGCRKNSLDFTILLSVLAQLSLQKTLFSGSNLIGLLLRTGPCNSLQNSIISSGQ